MAIASRVGEELQQLKAEAQAIKLHKQAGTNAKGRQNFEQERGNPDEVYEILDKPDYEVCAVDVSHLLLLIGPSRNLWLKKVALRSQCRVVLPSCQKRCLTKLGTKGKMKKNNTILIEVVIFLYFSCSYIKKL